jgi:hypothetical protein
MWSLGANFIAQIEFFIDEVDGSRGSSAKWTRTEEVNMWAIEQLTYEMIWNLRLCLVEPD